LDTAWQCEVLHCGVMLYSACAAHVRLVALFVEDLNSCIVEESDFCVHLYYV